MEEEIKKIEIIAYQPTHIKLRFLPFGNEVKMGKRFFQRKVNSGFYEIVNKDKIPSII